MDNRKERTADYKKLVGEISALLDKYDPANIQGPIGEYGAEAEKITTYVAKTSEAQVLSEQIARLLSDRLDLPSNPADYLDLSNAILSTASTIGSENNGRNR